MSRRINEQESKLHQAALAGPKHEITSKQAEAVIPETKARQNALNFLLSVGLFKSLKDAKGNIIFRAVTKGELEQTKDLSGEESLVLGHIKATANEGIWTKHLKTKTNLHQTIVDRCLKTLIQKKLIKRVPSVQSIWSHSVGLTGGPWYTENELDTVFIDTISKACLKFIRDVSFPSQRKEGREGALFPISNAPRYPTAAQIHNTLRQARLTETELTVEHIEMLLDVLVLDGEVEKLPAFGPSLWDANAVEDGESDEEKKVKKKRRRSDSSDEDAIAALKAKRKKKKRADSDSDEEETSRKKSKSKRRRKADSSSESESESDAPKRKKKKKKKKTEDSSDSEEDTSRKKKKKKNESDDESDESDAPKRKKKKKKVKKESSDESDSDDDRGHRSRIKRSPSPLLTFSFDDGAGAVVYRAINQEKVTIGWTEAPCNKCPSFEFCKEGGPVNAKECVYYADWLVAGQIAFDDEI
ncbi:RNA polymerase Rpc34 [Roridomyces roridus]|uniref:RNA polymerase Rpc34 n=1 Tax=Roridomyces roridus TaxID=1738132 RepID=A0AAD7FUG6_9AGAR|nr:RNA polymerase Rpc34 [Roridomyces roridus]